MNEGVYIFPKSISPKVKIIAQLEFKFTYYNVIVQLFSHFTTETRFLPPTQWLDIVKMREEKKKTWVVNSYFKTL